MGIVTPTVSPSNVPTQISSDDPSGEIVFPRSSSLGGFFGKAPIAQPGGVPNRGIIGTVTVYSSTQSPTAVTANTTAEKAMTVTGVAATDLPLVNKPTSQAGLLVASARASATNTVQVTFGNVTGSTITPTATETYVVTTIPAGLTQSVTLSPAAVAANSIVEQQFNVSTIAAGDITAVSKPTLQAGLAVVGSRAVANGVLGISFLNASASAITPTAAEAYLYYAGKELAAAPVMTIINASLAPTSVAANTTAEQTFTVTGLAAGTEVWVDKPSITQGLAVGGVRVSAANTLAINFVNATGAAIVPPTETYTISYFNTAAPAAGTSTAVNAQQSVGTGAALVALGLVGGP